MKGTQQAATTSAFGFLLARGDGAMTLLAIHNAMNSESSPETRGFLEVMKKRLA